MFPYRDESLQGADGDEVYGTTSISEFCFGRRKFQRIASYSNNGSTVASFFTLRQIIVLNLIPSLYFSYCYAMMS
jgi:hypothetical protein